MFYIWLVSAYFQSTKKSGKINYFLFYLILIQRLQLLQLIDRAQDLEGNVGFCPDLGPDIGQDQDQRCTLDQDQHLAIGLRKDRLIV